MRWEATEAGKAYYKAYQQKWHQERKQDPEYLERRRKQQREYRSRLRAENPEAERAKKNRWRQEKATDQMWRNAQSRKRMQDEKKFFELFPERKKRRQKQQNLRARFSLSLAEFDEMVARQSGLCAICGQPERAKLYGVVKHLSVDHDHATGKIRELLCNACNRAIGLMKENPEALTKAAEYLRKHKSS